MDDAMLREALRGQYRAGLAMLTSAIEQCPETLWLAGDHGAPYWQIAYHTLFFTHLYLMPGQDEFEPWELQRRGYESLDHAPVPPFTRDELLAYTALCGEQLDGWVAALDLTAADCGFPWYRVGKLDHQFVNVRHLQHHVGQLADRLRDAGAGCVEWRGRA